MSDSILDLSKKLISIESTLGNTEELNRALDVVLCEMRGLKIEKFNNKGVQSVLIYSSKTRPQKFKVILNGHLDVVPGKNFQFKPKIIKGRLYGSGAADMKANLACFIKVFKEVVNKVSYPLGLQIVTDEELGGFKGTKFQIEKGVRADFVISGESTSLNIVSKTKGVLRVRISCAGKTSHGAYVWNGINAISQMSMFITRLNNSHPNPDREKWITTINVATIETNNKAFNKIPEYCEIVLDIRYIPEDKKKIIDDVRKLLTKDMKFEVIIDEPPLSNNDKNYYIQQLRKTCKSILGKEVKLYGAHGTSDARHFTNTNSTGIEFGAGGANIGCDNEYMDIKTLEKYEEILKKFLLSL